MVFNNFFKSLSANKLHILTTHKKLQQFYVKKKGRPMKIKHWNYVAQWINYFFSLRQNDDKSNLKKRWLCAPPCNVHEMYAERPKEKVFFPPYISAAVYFLTLLLNYITQHTWPSTLWLVCCTRSDLSWKFEQFPVPMDHPGLDLLAENRWTGALLVEKKILHIIQ